MIDRDRKLTDPANEHLTARPVPGMPAWAGLRGCCRHDVEFRSRGSFAPSRTWLEVARSTSRLASGRTIRRWHCALAESLLHCNGFDARDQMSRYANWWQWGYFSSTGECFDIGVTTRAALERFLVTGNPFSGASSSQDCRQWFPDAAGTGCAVLLPRRAGDRPIARDSSRTTHGAPKAVDCCSAVRSRIGKGLCGRIEERPVAMLPGARVRARLSRSRTGLMPAKSESGFSAPATPWSPSRRHCGASSIPTHSRGRSWRQPTSVTTPTRRLFITGQIAGAFYGRSAIPSSWLVKLHARDQIVDLACRLHDRAIR